MASFFSTARRAGLALVETASPLFIPLRILFRGHLRYLGFVGLTCAAGYLLLLKLELYALDFIHTLQHESTLSTERAVNLAYFTVLFIRTLYVPVVLTAIGLPTCQILAHGRVRFNPLLKAVLPALRDCFHSIIITLSSLLYISSPALILIAAYFFAMREIHSETMKQAYLVFCLASCILTLMRSLPLYFTPLVSVCSGYSPAYALSITRRVLGRHKLGLIIISTASFLALYSLRGIDDRPVALVCAAAIAWYGLTHLFTLIVCALAAFEQGQESTYQLSAACSPALTETAPESMYERTLRSAVIGEERLRGRR